MTRYLPDWCHGYDRSTLLRDGLAAVIVTLMLIPQSLAYAALAGLPPQVGLYASMAPLLLYALLGSSRVLAVGPVAVVSLMTASTVGQFAAQGTAHYAAVALTLAFVSGVVLMLMGVLRLGFLANFLSHPVASGFMTASALLIAAGQMKTVLGLPREGWHIGQVHGLSAALGLVALLLLWLARRHVQPGLQRLGLSPAWASGLAKATPVALIAITALFTWALQWQEQGVRIVGAVPAGLPSVSMPLWDVALLRELLLPALLISVVGFVESVSVGQTLAARRRQRIEPDRELLALGAGNVGAALTGGFPVTGGFARSVVNFDAGAQTPAAGVLTAIGILLVVLFLTPALYYVPHTVLAATIVVAVLSLIDTRIWAHTWRYAKGDFAAVLVTLLVTLGMGVEAGLLAGVGLSLAIFLFKTSRPHMAEVGLVPGTEHFRNVLRHQVLTSPQLLSLRVDESLYFANARALEDRINAEVARRPQLRHVVLLCSAINDIDASAVESLHSIDQRLSDAGIGLYFSEVKGPVMDRLQASGVWPDLPQRVFLTHYQAVQALAPEALR